VKTCFRRRMPPCLCRQSLGRAAELTYVIAGARERVRVRGVRVERGCSFFNTVGQPELDSKVKESSPFEALQAGRMKTGCENRGKRRFKK
jgi:hypothetical protein